MQDNINIDEEEIEQGTVAQWLQDNLRVIISILIVIAIAGGIYSYSKRSEDSMTSQEVASENALDSESLEITTEKVAETTTPIKKEETQKITQATSQDTGSAFIETAGMGDGKTVLARRALANYLEKNTDSTLTAEHKIYIEDYLRKKVAHTGSIRVGTSVEFSKNLIQEAIEKSKNLNEKQLQNLHKYAVRVPSLS